MDTAEVVDNILIHYGRKGMRWGVRTRSSRPTAVIVKDKSKRIKTSGGKGYKAHPEALGPRLAGQKGKGSGPKALSNQELEAYTKRLNLEQNFKRASYADKPVVQRFVLTLLGQTGKNTANETANTVASRQIKKVLR